MEKTIKLPWASWREPGFREFTYPDTWDVSEARMNNLEEISDSEIKNAILNPIGSEKLSDIAKGKENAVIIIDDMSRPTPISKIIPHVLEELHKSGLSLEKVTIIGAIGAHRPLNRRDYILKLGKEIVEKYNIENHHPYENLIDLGETKMGTPLHVNKTYYNADLKIAISGVIPHPLAGYGGGAKIVLPGVCGIETLNGNHSIGMKSGTGAGIGRITSIREDIEDSAKIIGLHFSINIIFTEYGKIGGVFAGNFIDSHRKAIELGDIAYNTVVTKDNDLGFFNLYPEDTELTQGMHKALNFLMTAPNDMLKRRGAIVIMADCYEGRGFHSLIAERGSKLYSPINQQIIWKAFVKRRKVYCFSENLSKSDIDYIYGKDAVLLYNKWEDLIEKLREEYGESLKAIIIPTSIQLCK
ncbi:MAG: lactate racemase domain-containing protein [Promethearchaeota archaeon]